MPKTIANKHFAVIDVGSNTIRLVIFDALSRAAHILLNEKITCGLAQGIEKTGYMTERNLQHAIEVICYFCELARGWGLKQIMITATAAVREARNQNIFVTRIFKETGIKPRIISGEEEACFSANGILYGFQGPQGIVADLGGGSLELAALHDDDVFEKQSLPIGLIRAQEKWGQNFAVAIDDVETMLTAIPWLQEYHNQNLYLIGGTWRALAKIHMHEAHVPLHIIHAYHCESESFANFCRKMMALKPEALKKFRNVSSKRLAQIPYACLIVNALMQHIQPKTIYFSAHGLREGLLYRALNDDLRKQDPLMVATKDICQTQARNPEFSVQLPEYLEFFYNDLPQKLQRLLKAAAMLSDLHWQIHPDYRAKIASQWVWSWDVPGITHEERSFLSYILLIRYQGLKVEASQKILSMLSAHEIEIAKMFGVVLKFYHKVTGSSQFILQTMIAELSQRHLYIKLPQQHPLQEIYDKHKASLSKVLRREIIIS